MAKSIDEIARKAMATWAIPELDGVICHCREVSQMGYLEIYTFLQQHDTEFSIQDYEEVLRAIKVYSSMCEH